MESKKRFLRSEGWDAGLGRGRTSFCFRSYHWACQLHRQCGGWGSYLDAGVLRSEVEGLVVGGVGEAEDVAQVVGRPEGEQAVEARGAPDLACQLSGSPEQRVVLTLTMGSVALEKSSDWSCDRVRASTLPLCASMVLRSS